jgi:hypothetical protein
MVTWVLVTDAGSFVVVTGLDFSRIGRGGPMKATATGYDGNGYCVGDRVELHPATDLWMRGARYGTVESFWFRGTNRVSVRLDKLPGKVFVASPETFRSIEGD